MRVKQVICAAGRSGYMHRDLMAIKSGKGIPDGSLYRGKAMSPGFTRIIEPHVEQVIALDCLFELVLGGAQNDVPDRARTCSEFS